MSKTKTSKMKLYAGALMAMSIMAPSTANAFVATVTDARNVQSFIVNGDAAGLFAFLQANPDIANSSEILRRFMANPTLDLLQSADFVDLQSKLDSRLSANPDDTDIVSIY